MTWSGPVKMEDDELPAGAELDGRYRIRSLLGEGGMGTVYLAEDLARGHDIALKILIPRYRGRPERERRLLNEAELAGRIGEHPNLPRLHGAGRLHDLGGCPFIAWEVVHGLDLNALLALRHTIQPRVAVRWCRQLAEALCAVHRAGVVHRDVTVTNVFIEDPDGDPRVKLIDLSHAALLPRAGAPISRITRELEVAGAHRFMPPEQALSAPPHPKMDVFSFGVVLYEMLTGRNPFRHVQHREAYIELQRAGQLQVARIDRRVYPSVPESLVELVEACTHNAVELRLDMIEVLQRLEEPGARMSRPVLVAADERPADLGDDGVDDNVATGPAGRPSADDEVIQAKTEPVDRRGGARAVTAERPAQAASARRGAVAPRRALPIVVLVATTVVALTAAAVFLMWPGGGVPAAAEVPPAIPSGPSGPEALPRVEPVAVPSVEPEAVEAHEPELLPPVEPKDDEATPAPPEGPPAEVAAPETAELEPSQADERRPARPARPAPHDTETCRSTVADALAADTDHAWPRLESLTRRRKCFVDRRRWSQLRARALLETGRLDECAALAKTYENDVVQKYAGICRAQRGTP